MEADTYGYDHYYGEDHDEEYPQESPFAYIEQPDEVEADSYGYDYYYGEDHDEEYPQESPFAFEEDHNEEESPFA